MSSFVRSRFVLVLALALLTMAGRAGAVATLRASQTPAPDVTSQAQTVFNALVAQDFAAVLTRFNAQMKQALTEAQLKTTWASVIAQAGAFKRVVSSRVIPNGGLQVVVLRCEFERVALDVQVAIEASGLVAGLAMRPSAEAVADYVPPTYATPSAYVEQDATVGAAPWALSATLTLPNGAGPFPAVVLVHGSGPNDRDESIGPNKPFRDLALGLASRGVAVLRYEKRTRQYGSQMAAMSNLTVKEEVVDDVVAAVDLLRRTPKIDPQRIVVLGHSLGGTLVPRIAAADSRIAGFVILAGAVRPLQQAMLEQSRYLANADGTVTADEQKALDQIEQMATAVAALTETSPTTGPALGGVPVSYWLALRGYDPAASAKAISQPLLVLQGERDYQVTIADDFAKWKSALDGKSSVTFRTYPAANHLFIAGTGRSLPPEYGVAGHVMEDVIRDIAAWVSASVRAR